MTDIKSKTVTSIEKLIHYEVHRQTVLMARRLSKMKAQRDNWKARAIDYREKLQNLKKSTALTKDTETVQPRNPVAAGAPRTTWAGVKIKQNS
jgi:hypothetical protein